FIAVEAITPGAMKPALDIIGLFAQAVGRVVADHIAAIEPADLILNPIDPRLKRAGLGDVVVPVSVVSVGGAIVGAVWLGRRIILSRSRGRDGKSYARGRKGNQKSTHQRSPSSMRMNLPRLA